MSRKAPKYATAPTPTRLEVLASELSEVKAKLAAQPAKVETAKKHLKTVCDEYDTLVTLHKDLQQAISYEALLVKPE